MNELPITQYPQTPEELRPNTTLLSTLRELAQTTNDTHPNNEIHATALNTAAKFLEAQSKMLTPEDEELALVADTDFMVMTSEVLLHMATDEHMDEKSSEALIKTAFLLAPQLAEECI